MTFRMGFDHTLYVPCAQCGQPITDANDGMAVIECADSDCVPANGIVHIVCMRCIDGFQESMVSPGNHWHSIDLSLLPVYLTHLLHIDYLAAVRNAQRRYDEHA